MNTYALQPMSSFLPVFWVRARTASEALSMTSVPLAGIWQVRTQPVN